MTEQDRKEWLQDMREEARADEIEEYKMRSDYDYFLSRLENQYNLVEFVKWYKEIQSFHEQYDWEFNIDEII